GDAQGTPEEGRVEDGEKRRHLRPDLKGECTYDYRQAFLGLDQPANLDVFAYANRKKRRVPLKRH
nr:hypothetical protein [Candidatus Njordarchaeum guaymaensis]